MYNLYITMFIRKIKKKNGTYLAKLENSPSSAPQKNILLANAR